MISWTLFLPNLTSGEQINLENRVICFLANTPQNIVLYAVLEKTLNQQLCLPADQVLSIR